MTPVSTRQVFIEDGYIAPEYTSRGLSIIFSSFCCLWSTIYVSSYTHHSNVFILCIGHLTTKSNVYTFGAVLTELLSGFPASNLNWVKKYFSKKSKVLQIMDIRLEGRYSEEAAYKVAKLAEKCLNKDPKSRPRMADVVVALQQLQRLWTYMRTSLGSSSTSFLNHHGPLNLIQLLLRDW